MSYSILIIDDNEADRYVLLRLLKKTGLNFKSYEAENGEEALKFLNSPEHNCATQADNKPPMVCFLDINMPIVDGWTFLEELARTPNISDYRTMAVVMFSSSSNAIDIEKAKTYEFVTDYIVKGEVSAELLKKKIESSSTSDS